LARLPKALTDGVLPKDFDGDQIYEVLQGVLLSQWQSVPGALTWATYDPTETWATTGNTGLGEIDRPGNYELAARTSNRTNVYTLVSALATSGLGYIYEDAQGRIGYADSTHRTNYLAANGYVDLDANSARAAGLRIQTRVGDVRNAITINYGTNSNNSVSDSDPASISIYGNLAQIISTTLHDANDANAQAAFYLSLRANPQPIFSQITFDLTNDELDDSDRDNLLNVFMGQPILLNDLPTNMSSSAFQGFFDIFDHKTFALKVLILRKINLVFIHLFI
jgi:hypothetical protein